MWHYIFWDTATEFWWCRQIGTLSVHESLDRVRQRAFYRIELEQLKHWTSAKITWREFAVIFLLLLLKEPFNVSISERIQRGDIYRPPKCTLNPSLTMIFVLENTFSFENRKIGNFALKKFYATHWKCISDFAYKPATPLVERLSRPESRRLILSPSRHLKTCPFGPNHLEAHDQGSLNVIPVTRVCFHSDTLFIWIKFACIIVVAD